MVVHPVAVARVKASMTRRELSAASGVKEQTIADIEVGKRLPRLATLRSLAAVLGFDMLEAWKEGRQH